MRLLFDENLSRKLVQRLADLFPGSSHAATEGLLHCSDEVVWRHAQRHDFTIVTADADFYELATALGPPPKVIWLRGCDYPTAVAEELIRNYAVRVAEFHRNRDQGVLVLRRKLGVPNRP